MIETKIEIDGVFKNSQFFSFRKDLKKDMFVAIEKAYIVAGKEIAKKLQTQASSVFKAKRKGFIKSFSSKIYNEYKDSPPALLLGSKIPWMGIHQYGGTVRPGGGLLLIPKTKKRIGPKEFKKLMNNLIQSKNAYFRVMKNGKIGLFSQTVDENLNSIQRLSGKNKLRKETLIAIGVKSVSIRKRLRTIEIVKENTSVVTREIEKQLKDF